MIQFLVNSIFAMTFVEITTSCCYSAQMQNNNFSFQQCVWVFLLIPFAAAFAETQNCPASMADWLRKHGGPTPFVAINKVSELKIQPDILRTLMTDTIDHAR